MKYVFFIYFCFLFCFFSCREIIDDQNDSQEQFSNKTLDLSEPLLKISFGSCNKEWLSQSYWKTIREENSNLWIWLGDIIYADTEDMNNMAAKYKRLKYDPNYLEFRRNTSIIGIWDDHDYGVNDGDKNYPQKDESKQLLFEFLEVPSNNPAHDRKGAYQSYTFGPTNQKIKIILLDTRYFRDELIPNSIGPERYQANINGTILGDEQWKWFESELRSSDADINIISSGIQFLHTEQYFEKWANFPTERNRLLELLSEDSVENVVLLSGDRHISELAKIALKNNKNIYEVTSSGLTHIYDKNVEPNKLRIGDLIKQRNYTVMDFNWSQDTVQCVVHFKAISGSTIDSYSWKYAL